MKIEVGQIWYRYRTKDKRVVMIERIQHHENRGVSIRYRDVNEGSQYDAPKADFLGAYRRSFSMSAVWKRLNED